MQVFAGIINNSSKFSDLGTEIRINASQEEQRLTVTITDQGAGIADELLPQVFDMFTRGRASRETPRRAQPPATTARQRREAP